MHENLTHNDTGDVVVVLLQLMLREKLDRKFLKMMGLLVLHSKVEADVCRMAEKYVSHIFASLKLI